MREGSRMVIERERRGGRERARERENWMDIKIRDRERVRGKVILSSVH